MAFFQWLPPLTSEPRRPIAAEAQRWGEEDDITIVKVPYA
jgi:hypothetical protein